MAGRGEGGAEGGDGLVEPARWRDLITGELVTTHDFRSTFRDWAGEATAHSREVVEAALAHGIKDKAEAAYARGDPFEKRRELMEAWTRFLGQ